MDEALKHHQHLQFCKQLGSLQQQLCEDTYTSDGLLSSLYALGKYMETPSCCLVQLAATFPEFAAKIQRFGAVHPLRELHIEQMEGAAVETISSSAEALARELQPMYRELQELGKFMARASSLLANLHQLLIPITMATAPELIEFFMTLFCNTIKIVLLMEQVPWKTLVQVYTIVTTAMDGNSPPGRTAVCELLEKLQDPVKLLQEMFQPISSRVSQVLELAVNAVLDHVANAKVLEASSVFDVTRLGSMQLGITGLSLQRTYSFIQRLDDFRSWALLGFLACPSALQGMNAQQLLAALLSDSLLLPIYADIMLPLHTLYQQHVTPALAKIVSGMLESSASKADMQQQVQDAKQLFSTCYQTAVEGAEAEHAARRRYIARVLQDLLGYVMDVPGSLPGALQMALAAQAYAKSELLWYFRHVGDKLPVGPTANDVAATAGKLVLPLLPPPKEPQFSADGHVVCLIAAATSLYDMLEEHRELLQGHLLEVMRALLEQQLLPETAAILATADKNAQELPSSGKDRVVPQILAPLVKAVTYPLAELCEADSTTRVAGAAAPVQQAAAHTAAPQPTAAANAATETVAQNEPPAAVQPEDAAADKTAAANTADSPAAVLRRAQQHMVHLTMLLSSRNLWMRPTVLEAPAQDPQYLETIHRVLELCPFAVSFVSALERICGLNELVHHQHKLVQLQQHVLQDSSLAAREQLSSCPHLIKVLHWFEHNLPVVTADGDGPREYAWEANLLACQLLEEQCGTVALFLAQMAQELIGGLYVTLRAEQAKHISTANPAPAIDTDVATVADQRVTGVSAAVAKAGGAAHASVRSRAVALAHSLNQVHPVQVSSNRVVVPVEYLRAALQQCLLLQVNDIVRAADQLPLVPSQLVRILQDLLWAASELLEVLSIDVRPELWRILLNHAQPDWVVPPSRDSHAAPVAAASAAWSNPGSTSRTHQSAAQAGDADASASPAQAAWAVADAYNSRPDRLGFSTAAQVPLQLYSIVLAYGEWYMQHVVRDVKGQGVLYAPQLRRFTCVAGSKDILHQRASVQELTALLQVFGPYAAVKLAEMTEGAVLDCLSQLDGCLSRWKGLLDPVTMAVVRDDSCADAVSAACSQLTNEAQVLTQARQLSRCLAFRQLLGEAAATALASMLPIIAATVDTVGSNMLVDLANGSSNKHRLASGINSSAVPAEPANCTVYEGTSGVVAGRHLCDLFDLPRPGLQGVGSPVVADPIVVNTLVGSNNYQRYKAWFNLPTLLGLSLNSPTIATTTLNLTEHSMANELHALIHAVKCLALAQQQAANRVLTCGSRFLHPESRDQAQGMLACFVKVAATTLYIRQDPVQVATCKQLLLESLSCPQLPASKLADAWVPATRIRSAMCQVASQ